MTSSTDPLAEISTALVVVLGFFEEKFLGFTHYATGASFAPAELRARTARRNAAAAGSVAIRRSDQPEGNSRLRMSARMRAMRYGLD